MTLLKYGATVVPALVLLGACRDAAAPVAPAVPASLSAASSNAAGSVFTMQDLGVLPGGSNSVAYAINTNGDVAGSSEAGAAKAGHAVMWIGTTPTDLGVPYGLNATAYGINNSRAVVGYATSGVTSVGFFWKAGKYTLISAGVGPLVQAAGVNNSDVTVGYYRGTNPLAYHAFKFTVSGGLVDLHPAGYSESLAWAINDAGTIVGSVKLSNGQRHVAQWSATGQFTDRGTLGGSYGEAIAVNGLGEMVGQSSALGKGMQPFVWRVASGMASLGSGGEAEGISDRGRIVGTNNGFPLTAKGSPAIFTLPGFPGGGNNGIAYAVNACGTVTGNSSVAFRVFHAVRWNISACD